MWCSQTCPAPPLSPHIPPLQLISGVLLGMVLGLDVDICVKSLCAAHRAGYPGPRCSLIVKKGFINTPVTRAQVYLPRGTGCVLKGTSGVYESDDPAASQSGCKLGTFLGDTARRILSTEAMHILPANISPWRLKSSWCLPFAVSSVHLSSVYPSSIHLWLCPLAASLHPHSDHLSSIHTYLCLPVSSQNLQLCPPAAMFILDSIHQ